MYDSLKGVSPLIHKKGGGINISYKILKNCWYIAQLCILQIYIGDSSENLAADLPIIQSRQCVETSKILKNHALFYFKWFASVTYTTV